MGIAVDPGGRGSRKPASADLNLVPYIDLLTCMVAFLLITAVWTQLASLALRGAAPGLREADTPPEPVPRLAVNVTQEGFSVVDGADVQPLPRRQGAYDFAGLRAALDKLKTRFPDRLDLQIASEDAVRFEVLVRTMDAAVGARFPDVALVDAGG